MAEKAFTTEQNQVIQHNGGHAVVAAVAGSGKTETLLGRVRHLIRDCNPDQIAVVMFNKDAAQSFRDRYEKAGKGKAPEIRTFNSMGNKIVNRFVQIGLLPDAEIVEQDFRRAKLAKDTFTHVFKQLNGPEMSPDKELIDGFKNYLLMVKSDTKTPGEVFENGKYSKAAEGYPDAFMLYEQERGKRKLRFFEDQIYDPVMMMLRNPEAQRYVADKVDHLIVDEAQDMNGIQIALLRILAGKRAKVMLVGDEDQCIYDWRGSKPDYLTRGFERDFNNATRYTLPHTFRFGHKLSLAASQLITRNANRHPKISISSDETPRTRIRCIGLDHGVNGLGDTIKEALESGVRPNDLAVLVREYNLSVPLELELHQHGIPYHVYGRPPLSRIPEIAALIGVLKLAAGRLKSMEDEEFRWVLGCLLRHPTLYLDKVALDDIIVKAVANPDKLSDAIRSVIAPLMKAHHADQIRDRADLLEILATSISPDDPVVTVLNLYMQGTRFEEAIKRQAANQEVAGAIMANVTALLMIAGRHLGTVAEFLEEIDPLIDATRVEPPDEPHVWISSIHRAKGAQWPVVFVPGLAARSFPRDNLEHEQIEAERRLFYVAVTRASQELFLAHPKDPSFSEASGNILSQILHSIASPVSRFLWEMDLAIAEDAGTAIENKGPFKPAAVDRPRIANKYLERFPFASAWSYSKRDNPKPQKSEPTTSIDGTAFPSGTRVIHAVFGRGKVDHWIDARVVKVIFDSGDSRMLVASMARLQKQDDSSPTASQSRPSASDNFDDEEIPF